MMLFARKVLLGCFLTIGLVMNIQAQVSTARLEPSHGLIVQEDQLRAGLLYDIDKNTIVWEKGMDIAYPIASLTKMMVALLAVEDIQAEKRDWSDEITVTRSYKKSPRSRKVITTQETYTLESLVQLAMIPSNNDACADIGRHLNGTVESFVVRMNARAAELGMTSTFFSNPSGLPGVVSELDNRASPRDLLTLCLELLKHEDVLRITSIGYAEITNDKRKAIHRNHNRLVIDYDEYVDGLKTGYTRRAGFCLAATAKHDDVRLVSIVLGVGSSAVRNDIVASMMNQYYAMIGCGAMKPSFKTPTPTPANAVMAQADSNVVYKTVWTKQWKSHRVRSGESLTTIAKKYKSTYTQLKKWNKLKSDRIHPGQQLNVFVNVKKTVAIKVNPDPVEDEDVPEVPKNETLAKADSIAKPTTTMTIANANTTKSVTEKPVSSTQKPVVKKTPSVRYVYHTVQSGDTLWSIARKYKGVSADDIKKANKLTNANVIKPGTKLKIKVGG